MTINHPEIIDKILELLTFWAREKVIPCGYCEVYVFGSLIQKGGAAFEFCPQGSDIDLLLEFNNDHDTPEGRTTACFNVRDQVVWLEQQLIDLLPKLPPDKSIISAVPITRFELDFSVHYAGDFHSSLDGAIFRPLIEPTHDGAPIAFGRKNNEGFRSRYNRAYKPLFGCQKDRYSIINPGLDVKSLPLWNGRKAIPKQVARAAANLRFHMRGDLKRTEASDVSLGMELVDQILRESSDGNQAGKELCEKVQTRRTTSSRDPHLAFSPEEKQLLWEIVSESTKDYLEKTLQTFEEAHMSIIDEMSSHTQDRPPPGGPYRNIDHATRKSFERRIFDQLNASMPVSLFGPKGYGKNWLRGWTLEMVRRQWPTAWIVQIRWSDYDVEHRETSETFTRQTAELILARVKAAGYSNEVDPDTILTQAWEANYGLVGKIQTFLLELFKQIPEQPLLLVFPEADPFLKFPLAESLFAMLGRWSDGSDEHHENFRPRLRMMFVLQMSQEHSTQKYPGSVTQKGRMLLPPFKSEQIDALSKTYNIRLTEKDVQKLGKKLGGHPHMTDQVLYHVSHDDYRLQDILKPSLHEIFQHHVGSLEVELARWPHLMEAFVHIRDNPGTRKVAISVMEELNTMGLIRLNNGQGSLISPLYKHIGQGHP